MSLKPVKRAKLPKRKGRKKWKNAITKWDSNGKRNKLCGLFFKINSFLQLIQSSINKIVVKNSRELLVYHFILTNYFLIYIFDDYFEVIKQFELVLLEPVVHFSCALIHLVSLSIHCKENLNELSEDLTHRKKTYLSFFSFSSLAFFSSSLASRSLWIRPMSSCSFCSCSFAFILADETDSLETERGTKATCLHLRPRALADALPIWKRTA